MRDLWRQRKKLAKKEKDYCISFYYSRITFVFGTFVFGLII
jgi:hypothetical protein